MRRLLLLLALSPACAPTASIAVSPLPARAPTGAAGTANALAWSLVGNDLTPGHDTLALAVTAPADTEVVDAWRANERVLRLERRGDAFRGTLPVADLAPGEYTLRFAADGADQPFAEHTFVRTHPLYVVTTTDWDTPDTPDENLARHSLLHERHPALKITHLVGPYTFTDLTLAPERVDELVAWCLGMQADHGDEVGVHIHPYLNLVEAVDVPFHDRPTDSGRPDPTGYRVFLSTYTEEEVTRMLELTCDLFVEYGLGRPTSFRAGAWNADAGVMRALANAGFVADTSALNPTRIEEWEGAPLHDWLVAHWTGIDDASQPYYMNRDDPLSAEPPQLPVLQVPDNGLLVDYVTGAEMIEVFRACWPGGALAEPRAVSIGWHPINFGEPFLARIDEALTEFDRHLAAEDAGPVVYANLSDMARVWKAPPAK